MMFSRSTLLLMFLSLETLTSIIRTGLPILVELINLVDSVISYGLIQILNFPTQISPTLLHFFLSSDATICSPMTFPPLGNSYHVVMFHGRLVIFELGASAAASKFYKWVQVGIDVCISHRQYQVKSPFISLVFSCLLLPQFIEITFFACTKRINLMILK